MTDYRLPTETQIGDVHLQVSGLERALGLNRDLLGFRPAWEAGATVLPLATAAHRTMTCSQSNPARGASHCAALGSTKSPSAFRHGRRWRVHSSAWWPSNGPSRALQTTW